MSVPRLDETAIMLNLGLRSWEEQWSQAFKQVYSTRSMLAQGWRRHIGRRSGRTTRMLVKAIEASQMGPVTILGSYPQHSIDLVRRARAWAESLNIDPMRIELGLHRDMKDDSVNVFVDHHGLE